MVGIDIFDASFDRGDWSEFLDVTSSTSPSISAAAALAGTSYGLAVDVAVGDDWLSQQTITWNVDTLRLRVHFHPNDIVLADTNARRIYGTRDAVGDVRHAIEIRDSTGSGNIEVRALVVDDGIVERATSWYAITSDEHWLEMRSVRASTAAASDGTLTLWIDGVQKEHVTGLDVFDVSRATLAAVQWSNANASDTGTYYIDELIARSEDVEIGAVELSHTLAKATHAVGDFSEYDDTDGTDGPSPPLTVTSAAALAGSAFGVALDMANGSSAHAEVDFSRAVLRDVIRCRFHFDPNTPTFVDANPRNLFNLRDSVGLDIAGVHIRDNAGSLELRAYAREDGGLPANTVWFGTPDFTQHIEIRYQRASSDVASDGRIDIYLNDVLGASATGLDIDGILPAVAARFDWVGNASDSGTMYLDELEVRDTDAVIGSAVRAQKGAIAVTVGGSAVDYIIGSGQHTPSIGAQPSTFYFKSRSTIAENKDVVVTRTWTDDAGNQNRVETLFAGRVQELEPAEIGVSGVYETGVHCVDGREKANQTLITTKFRERSSQAAFAVVDSLLPAAFSIDVDDGDNVGPWDLQDRPAMDFAAEIATQAGQIMWMTSGKVIRSVAPDAIAGSVELNRVDAANWSRWNYRKSPGKVRNRIIVRGDDGRSVVVDSTGSQDFYGGVRPMVFSAHGARRYGTLNIIGAELLAAHKIPIVEGSITARFDRIQIGDTIGITDLVLKLRRFPVRITSITENQLDSQEWEQTISFTSERLLPRLVPARPEVQLGKIGARGPDLDPPAPIKRKPPRVVHRAPIEGPDTAKSAGASEYIGQTRLDKDNGRVRLLLDSNHVGAVVNQGWKIEILSRNALTVSVGTSGTTGGEDTVIWDNGTKHVTVVSSVSGDEGPWSLNNQAKLATLTITGNAVGARIILTLFDGDVGSGLDDVMDAFFIGTDELDSDIDITRDVIYEFWLEPQLKKGQVEDGLIDKQIAGGDNHSETYDDGSKTNLVLDAANRRVANNTGLGTGLSARSGGLYNPAGSVQAVDASARLRGDVFDGTDQRTAAQMVVGRDRAVAAINASDEVVVDVVRDGVATLLDVSAQDALNLQLLDSVMLGTTNPIGAGDARAGANRGLEFLTSAGSLAGYVERGVTGWKDGATEWGFENSGGDGMPVEADSGQSGGGGTGEGGDTEPPV